MNAIKWSAAALGLLFLAACSGGSGGGSAGPVVAASQEMNQDEEAASAKPATQEEFHESVSGQVSGLLDAIKPAFGSVLVITNDDVTGVESTFEDGSPTVTVNRDVAGDIVLDPASADVVIDHGAEASYVNLPGRTGRTRDLLESTDSSITASRVAVDWDNNDPSDYLAGGYWLRIETQQAAIEVGAFIDGPELDKNNPPIMPVSGTASYQGSAGGLYLAVAGTDAAYPSGSEEIGDFVGVATLNADFLAGTIDGCVGCVGDILLTGRVLNSATGLSDPFMNEPSDVQVNFGSVPFDRSDGTFYGRNVTASSETASIVQSGGLWAGQFSNIPNTDGDPRLVGGAFGGYLSTAGGSEALFVGAFAAGAQ